MHIHIHIYIYMHTYTYTCISNRCFPYKSVSQDVSGKHARYEDSKFCFIFFQYNRFRNELAFENWHLAPHCSKVRSGPFNIVNLVAS